MPAPARAHRKFARNAAMTWEWRVCQRASNSSGRNAGHQPAKTEIFDNKGEFLKEISISKTNTIRISPDSRVLCLAGFGNLGGDMEFFSLENANNKTYKMQLGKTKFHCGVSINWSNDSKYLVISVLSPRLRVDNEYKVLYH